MSHDPRARSLPPRARISFGWHDFDAASRRFAEVLDKHPTSDLAGFAFNLLLDSLLRLERYDELARALDTYCAQSSPVRHNPEIEPSCARRHSLVPHVR